MGEQKSHAGWLIRHENASQCFCAMVVQCDDHCHQSHCMSVEVQ